MKTKIPALAILPLLAILAGCQANDSQEAPNSRVHGSIGTRVQSQDTSHISPDRPTN